VRTAQIETVLLALLVLVGVPNSVSSQVLDSIPPTPGNQEIVQDTVSQPPDSIGRITPGGAFLRSALVPGWGHTRVGAHGRGAFYFTVETVNAFLFFKTKSRLAKIKDQRALLEEVVTARLLTQGMEDPEEIEAALAEDPVVSDLRLREESRSEQLEDWMALGIFFLFLSGADAFVSAHLADFPAAVEIDPAPAGGVEVGLSISVGG
jgi:hypothetical protein